MYWEYGYKRGLGEEGSLDTIGRLDDMSYAEVCGGEQCSKPESIFV